MARCRRRSRRQGYHHWTFRASRCLTSRSFTTRLPRAAAFPGARARHCGGSGRSAPTRSTSVALRSRRRRPRAGRASRGSPRRRGSRPTSSLAASLRAQLGTPSSGAARGGRTPGRRSPCKASSSSGRCSTSWVQRCPTSTRLRATPCAGPSLGTRTLRSSRPGPPGGQATLSSMPSCGSSGRRATCTTWAATPWPASSRGATCGRAGSGAATSSTACSWTRTGPSTTGTGSGSRAWPPSPRPTSASTTPAPGRARA
mmetsp:Transcript_109684/g.341857  ORF Transcript_109684/g.341857 Transcript_109684/m.341857 type:complete len:257 (+) Transcript_109684:525-1295(+)